MSYTYGGSGSNGSWSGARCRAGIEYTQSNSATSTTVKWRPFGQIWNGYGSSASLWVNATSSGGETSVTKISSPTSYSQSTWCNLSQPAMGWQTRTFKRTKSNQTFPVAAAYKEAGPWAEPYARHTFTIPALSSWTYTFYNKSGGVYTTKTHWYGENTPVPSAPGVDGHTFQYWRRRSDGATIKNYSAVNKSDGFDPIYNINTWTYNYYNKENQWFTSKTHTFNQATSFPAAPDVNGWNFSYWKIGSSGDTTKNSSWNANGSESFYARYVRKKYVYSFDCGVSSITHEFDIPSTLPQAPHRDGYEFQGWLYKGNLYTTCNISGNIAFVAKYAATYFTYEFDLGFPPVKKPPGETAALPKPTVLPDYKRKEFMGWESGGVIYTDTCSIDRNMTFRAVYKPFTYCFLNYNDGSGRSEKLKRVNNQTLVLTPLEKDGYKFLGFSENPYVHATDDLVPMIYSKKHPSDFTLYALWEKIYEDFSVSVVKHYRLNNKVYLIYNFSVLEENNSTIINAYQIDLQLRTPNTEYGVMEYNQLISDIKVGQDYSIEIPINADYIDDNIEGILTIYSTGESNKVYEKQFQWPINLPLDMYAITE